ncbi:hypothetical protein ABPG74_001183 [Tetrahymena malaccensis]
MPITKYVVSDQMNQTDQKCNNHSKKQKCKKAEIPSFPQQVMNLLSDPDPLPITDDIVDCLEKKITQWLDANNIIQVNPIEKQYEYYKERKMGIISLKQRNSSPNDNAYNAIAFSKQTEEEINTSLKRPSPVSLSLGKNNLLMNRKTRANTVKLANKENI